ncbi:unnamed protein product [Tenebrio molitor]|nr:unnamed protein product [Tenebrio molitor]
MYVFFNRPWLCLKDCVNKYHWHSVHYTLRLRLFSVLRRNSVSVSPRHSVIGTDNFLCPPYLASPLLFFVFVTGRQRRGSEPEEDLPE